MNCIPGKHRFADDPKRSQNRNPHVMIPIVMPLSGTSTSVDLSSAMHTDEKTKKKRPCTYHQLLFVKEEHKDFYMRLRPPVAFVIVDVDTLGDMYIEMHKFMRKYLERPSGSSTKVSERRYLVLHDNCTNFKKAGLQERDSLVHFDVPISKVLNDFHTVWWPNKVEA